MADGPTLAEREDLAIAIRENPFLSLIDFSRDTYRTMLVGAITEQAEAYLRERAEEIGYDVRDGPTATSVILEAPRNGASKKVRFGGNRL